MSEKKEFAEIEKKLQAMASPGIRPGLARLAKLLLEVGTPQDKFPAVHIAGTNGKGSTAASLYSILRASGYKTALYTSPHLVDFSERLEIDGERISSTKWRGAIAEIESIIGRTPFFSENLPTYFELTTAAAMLITAKEEPDVAIFEAGMGGRLDATNILGDVRLSVIVPIGLDHMEYLGGTLAKVAAEKFAIMRRGAPALFAGSKELNAQFAAAAKSSGAVPYIFSSLRRITDASYSLRGCDFTLADAAGAKDSYHTPLVGTFQPENASLAVTAAELLAKDFPKITKQTIKAGAASAVWQGRMEVVSPRRPFIIDGGHNPHAMRRVAQTLKTLLPGRRVNIVVAMMKDKEVGRALAYLRGADAALFCTQVPGSARSLDAYEMKRAAEAEGLETAGGYDDPVEAINAALALPSPLLCCGSLFLVGYIKEHIDELRGL